MVAWILGLVSDAANTVAGVASAATARILAVYNLFVSFFIRIKAAVVGVRAAILAWVAAHLFAILSVLATLQWLTFTYLPARLGAVQAAVVTWAAQRIAQALAIAQAAVTALRAWVFAQLINLAKTITALQGWAVTQFSAALARLNRIEGYLFGTLATPERVAAYIVDAMARALGRWARDHAVSVGRMFVHWFMGGVVGALSTVEDLITRILFE